jgi:hypothetical protein
MGIANLFLAWEFLHMMSRTGAPLSFGQMLTCGISGLLMLTGGIAAWNGSTNKTLIVLAAVLIAVELLFLIYAFTHKAPSIAIIFAIFEIIVPAIIVGLLQQGSSKQFFLARS